MSSVFRPMHGVLHGLTCWKNADARRITRADLLEEWVKNPPTAASGPTPIEKAIAIEHLHEALELKANAGGAIKAKVREALKILEQ